MLKKRDQILYYLTIITTFILTFDCPDALAGSDYCCEAGAEASTYQEKSANCPREAKIAYDIWRKVNKPFKALTGYETEFSIVEFKNTGNQNMDNLGACSVRLCYPMKLYMTLPFIRTVLNEYSEDMLAFILAHELGHRAAHLTKEGTSSGTYFRGGNLKDSASSEALADKRAAFYMTMAGYSPAKLVKGPAPQISGILSSKIFQVDREVASAREGEVRKTLGDRTESGVWWNNTPERQSALLKSLNTFESYSALYEAMVDFYSSGDMETAMRLSNWADEYVMGPEQIPVPEIRLLRAISIMSYAIENGVAPWIEKTGMGSLKALSGLKCETMLLGAISLDKEIGLLGEGRPGLNTSEVSELLIFSKKLMDDAEAMGGRNLALLTARSCVNFYLGRTNDAEEDNVQSKGFSGPSTPMNVINVLENNNTLFAFQKFIFQNPRPRDISKEASTKWKTNLSRQKSLFLKPPALASTVSSLLSGNDDAGTDTVYLDANPKPSTKDIIFRKIPSMPEKYGNCPEGWKLAFTIPSMEHKPDDQDASFRYPLSGLTVCKNDNETRNLRLIHIHLDSSGSPGYSSIKKTLLIETSPEGPLKDPSSWVLSCGKKALRKTGITDQGNETYVINSPILNAIIFVVKSGGTKQNVEKIVWMGN